MLLFFLLNLSRVLNKVLNKIYKGALAILLFLVTFASIAIK